MTEPIKDEQEYTPVVMVKGNAHTPQRFWLYTECYNQGYEDELRKLGYVKSCTKPSTIKGK